MEHEISPVTCLFRLVPWIALCMMTCYVVHLHKVQRQCCVVVQETGQHAEEQQHAIKTALRFQQLIDSVQNDPKLLPQLRRTWHMVSQTVHLLAESEGYSHFLYMESLLGFHRHNGAMIPWDDTIRITLFSTDKDLTENYVTMNQVFYHFQSTLAYFPGYNCTLDVNNYVIRVFGQWPTLSEALEDHLNFEDWLRWPYVEVHLLKSVFDENGIKSLENPFIPIISFPAEEILPLQTGFFEHSKVMLPVNAERTLQRDFDLSTCSCVNEDLDSYISITCSDLAGIVEFSN